MYYPGGAIFQRKTGFWDPPQKFKKSSKSGPKNDKKRGPNFDKILINFGVQKMIKKVVQKVVQKSGPKVVQKVVQRCQKSFQNTKLTPPRLGGSKSRGGPETGPKTPGGVQNPALESLVDVPFRDVLPRWSDFPA